MTNYNLSLVFLSYVAAVIGSLVTLIAIRDALKVPKDARSELIVSAALSLSVAGIWSMHFIGMLAFNMPDMNMNYNWWLTALSLLICIGVVYIGLVFISDSFSIGKLILAGTFVGIGVAAMHYIGIMAMEMQADFQWDWGIVTISVVIAVTASIVALWLAMNVKHLWQMIASALVMGVAVCGMHYTGMMAVKFIYNAALPPVEAMDIGVVTFSLIVVSLDLIVLVVAMVVIGANRNYLKYR